jgi:small subunit ribosomal protein S24e
MDVKDIKSNKILLPRKEVTVFVAFEGATPSRKQLKKSVADKVKAKEELIIIRHIYTKYGSKEAEVIAYVYDDENAVKSLEYAKMIQKNSDKAPAGEKA